MALATNETTRTAAILKAQHQLDRLSKREEALRGRLPSLEDEITGLQFGQAQRAQSLPELHKNVATVRAAHEAANDYALLCQGTLSEHVAVAKLATAEAALLQAEADLQRVEAEAQAANDAAATRLAELAHEQEQLVGELDGITTKRASLQRLQAQARADLGEAEASEVSGVVANLQAQVAEHRAALLASQLELEQYLRDEALPRLKDWPEHLKSVHDLLPVDARDDAAAAVLAGELTYLNLLLTHARDLPGSLNSSLTQGVGTYLQFLTIPAEEVFAREHIQGDPARLRARREAVEALLKERRSRLPSA